MQSTAGQSRYPFTNGDSTRRRSAFGRSTPRKYGATGRVGSKDGPKKDIWISLLDSVASGKRLPEKNIFILGGTPESQKDFLNSLSQDHSNGGRVDDRQSKRTPPITNQFALGYTYHDVLDADHEDILARLSLYLLSDPSPSFMRLLKPLLTSKSLSNTLVVILLDWAQPWDWLRQLRDWIRLLYSLLGSLDDNCQEVMERVMKNWRESRGGSPAGANTLDSLPDVSLPLGPGELDEELGLPLCVVCQNADQTETLEKEHGWTEEDFDFVQQTIRTVLLKHGSSLIYTSPTNPNSLQTLIHSSLDIHSLLRREPVKHNIIDRDRILIPPIWDTWGKIRILQERFDVEAIHKGWTIDLQDDPVESSSDENQSNDDPPDQPQAGAIALYEETIRNPHVSTTDGLLSTTTNRTHKLEIEPVSTQTFLASQLEIIERLKHEEEHQQQIRSTAALNTNTTNVDIHPTHGLASKITDQIGPIQFNMGGIQIDADDMLKRIRNRHGENNTTIAAAAAATTTTNPNTNTSGISSVSPTPDHQRYSTASTATSTNNLGGTTAGAGDAAAAAAGFLGVNLTGGGNPSTPERKSENEALASFFAGLMRRGAAGAG